MSRCEADGEKTFWFQVVMRMLQKGDSLERDLVKTKLKSLLQRQQARNVTASNAPSGSLEARPCPGNVARVKPFNLTEHTIDMRKFPVQSVSLGIWGVTVNVDSLHTGPNAVPFPGLGALGVLLKGKGHRLKH